MLCARKKRFEELIVQTQQIRRFVELSMFLYAFIFTTLPLTANSSLSCFINCARGTRPARYRCTSFRYLQKELNYVKNVDLLCTTIT